MNTIEIEQTRHIEDLPNVMYCSPDCDLCYMAEWNEDYSPKRIDCVKEWMVDYKPGPDCPGPGIKELCPVGTTEELERLRNQNSQLTTALAKGVLIGKEQVEELYTKIASLGIKADYVAVEDRLIRMAKVLEILAAAGIVREQPL